MSNKGFFEYDILSILNEGNTNHMALNKITTSSQFIYTTAGVDVPVSSNDVYFYEGGSAIPTFAEIIGDGTATGPYLINTQIPLTFVFTPQATPSFTALSQIELQNPYWNNSNLSIAGSSNNVNISYNNKTVSADESYTLDPATGLMTIPPTTADLQNYSSSSGDLTITFSVTANTAQPIEVLQENVAIVLSVTAESEHPSIQTSTTSITGAQAIDTAPSINVILSSSHHNKFVFDNTKFNYDISFNHTPNASAATIKAGTVVLTPPTDVTFDPLTTESGFNNDLFIVDSNGDLTAKNDIIISSEAQQSSYKVRVICTYKKTP